MTPVSCENAMAQTGRECIEHSVSAIPTFRSQSTPMSARTNDGHFRSASVAAGNVTDVTPQDGTVSAIPTFRSLSTVDVHILQSFYWCTLCVCANRAMASTVWVTAEEPLMVGGESVGEAGGTSVAHEPVESDAVIVGAEFGIGRHQRQSANSCTGDLRANAKVPLRFALAFTSHRSLEVAFGVVYSTGSRAPFGSAIASWTAVSWRFLPPTVACATWRACLASGTSLVACAGGCWY